MIERRILLIVLAVLAGLTVFGVVSERILWQQIWEPEGLRRLLVVTGAYVTAAGLFALVRPGWFLPVLFLAIALYTAGTVGLGPPCAVLYVLGSSLLLGDALLAPGSTASRDTTSGPVASGNVGSADPAVAMILGLSVYVTLFNVAAVFRIHRPITHLILLAIPLLVFRGKLGALWSRGATAFRRASDLRGGDYAGAALLGFILLLHLLVVLKPEVSSDGLAIHLVVPAFIETHHQWTFDVKNYIWAVMPMNGDWAFATVYLLGGEFASRLLNYASLMLTLVLVFTAVRRWLSPALAALGTALLATTPLIQTATGSLLVENIWAAMILGAVISLDRYRESGRIGYLFAVAILGGAALASKFGAVSFLLPLLVFAVAAVMRRPVRPSIGIAVLATFMVCAAPPYLNAYLRTGNPVFPFLNGVFQSPYYPSESIRDGRFTETLNWSTLYDATFRSHKYFEGQDGGFGFQWFLLLPLSLILINRGLPFLFHSALTVGLAGSALILLTNPNVRYIYPALPLFTIAFGPLLAKFPAAVIAAAVTTALNVYCLGTSGWYHKDLAFNMLFKPDRAGDYLRLHAPERQLIGFLNAAGVSTPVAFLGRNHVAGLRAPAFSNTWHCDWFERALDKAQSSEAVLQLAENHRIEYFIAPSDMHSGVLRTFLDQHTVPLFTSGRYYVARLKSRLDHP